MTVPSWYSAVILNYRRAFKERYAKEFSGSDEVIFNIVESNHGYSTPEETDNAVLEDMKESMPE